MLQNLLEEAQNNLLDCLKVDLWLSWYPCRFQIAVISFSSSQFIINNYFKLINRS